MNDERPKVKKAKSLLKGSKIKRSQNKENAGISNKRKNKQTEKV